MSSNAYDRNLAFQAAKAGLRMSERMAENWLKTGLPDPLPTVCPTTATPTGLYVTPPAPANCTPLWEGPAPGRKDSFWHDANNDKILTDAGADGIAFSSAQLSLAPFYIVELIATNALCGPADPRSAKRCRRFRVTASGKTDDRRAQVILQSIYATE